MNTVLMLKAIKVVVVRATLLLVRLEIADKTIKNYITSEEAKQAVHYQAPAQLAFIVNDHCSAQKQPSHRNTKQSAVLEFVQGTAG